ncbi:hypothetical protein OSCT_0860 [Oscillochloris trichoides DG-6]|uniref:Uncharacterized protein n=1 Tax=Oscillochloris trichoides DG-6 TaxID=765420 RepID=E1IC09_9CHLR|nr:hypothetical protein [Oscillochloris trichoides]EFO81271.1 hypothetical protein OSCT_0860 [Oscillochloris trichoides DG-6]
MPVNEPSPANPFFLVPHTPDEPILDAVERGLMSAPAPLEQLSTLGDLVQHDPFFAEQLAALHTTWEVRPQPAQGWLARLRLRLAWWLLGPELAQVTTTHAALVRVIDSLTAHLDDERMARTRLEARLAALERTR